MLVTHPAQSQALGLHSPWNQGHGRIWEGLLKLTLQLNDKGNSLLRNLKKKKKKLKQFH